MSIARKDDKHSEDLVNEISAGFNQAIRRSRQATESAAAPDGELGDEPDGEQGAPKPTFVVTGDARARDKKRRSR